MILEGIFKLYNRDNKLLMNKNQSMIFLSSIIKKIKSI